MRLNSIYKICWDVDYEPEIGGNCHISIEQNLTLLSNKRRIGIPVDQRVKMEKRRINFEMKTILIYILQCTTLQSCEVCTIVASGQKQVTICCYFSWYESQCTDGSITWIDVSFFKEEYRKQTGLSTWTHVKSQIHKRFCV